MGLFDRRRKSSACDMCAKSEADGCRGLHDHVVEIQGDEPPWLPPGWRAQAQGEFTFLCLRCDSYPDQKWPHDGGASAAMMMHLGQAHNVGRFTSLSSNRIGMVKLG